MKAALERRMAEKEREAAQAERERAKPVSR
jgi:hypothetical protein